MMSAFSPSRLTPVAPASAGVGAPSAGDMAAAASFARLIGKLDYLNATDLAQVQAAYRYADQAHLGQLRNSGEPYITHPIAVAALCADWKLDAQALMAALLHDAMEDCGVSKSNLIELFGAPVAELVDGLTKLEKLEFTTREENQAESFRKMLLAMARDVRVILIKLADRSHNMRTLGASPRTKWARIASETLDVYAPIAHRLGLNQTYRELQELAFQHLSPWRHAILTKAVTRARGRRRDLIQRVQTEVIQAFDRHGLTCQIAGREKTLYSIYQKMIEKNLTFAQVSDIYGFRLIVPHTIDCYTGLGLLHQLYRPVPGRFKDYIAIAKVNGYQSLHTTVVGPAGIHVEFQVRTEAMHLVAETGVAAHWMYKHTGVLSATERDRQANKWLQSLLDIQSETRDAAEFWDHVKVDLVPDAIYVFTPKSQILSLPRGATVLDFAYAIHSNVGDHAVGASVNGLEAPLRAEVHNGDVVQIQTDPAGSPHPAWLSIVRTARARSKIRHHLKTLAQNEAESLGERLLVQALRAEGIDALPDVGTDGIWDKLLRFCGNRNRSELLTDLGMGRRIASLVAKKLVSLLAIQGQRPDPLLISRERLMAAPGEAETNLALDGSESASVRYGRCCRPIPGDPVVGYLGRGEGLTVHHADCNVARRLKQRDAERFIQVEWSDEPSRPFETAVRVTVHNGRGVLAKVATALASAEADITHIDMADEGEQGAMELRFVIAVRDTQQLEHALRNLRHTACVIDAERMLNASSGA